MVHMWVLAVVCEGWIWPRQVRMLFARVGGSFSGMEGRAGGESSGTRLGNRRKFRNLWIAREMVLSALGMRHLRSRVVLEMELRRMWQDLWMNQRIEPWSLWKYRRWHQNLPIRIGQTKRRIKR